MKQFRLKAEGKRPKTQDRADRKEIAQVASISANNDSTIGNLIADAMENSHDLAQTRARLNQAKAVLKKTGASP